MQLFRTVCSTDWKCRPSHSLVLVATSDTDAKTKDYNRQVLLEAMDHDVAVWMADEIAADEYNALVDADNDDVGSKWDGWDTNRAEELLDPSLDRDDLKKHLIPMWEHVSDSQTRFEMDCEDGELRSFSAHNNDGDRCTTDYHIVGD